MQVRRNLVRLATLAVTTLAVIVPTSLWLEQAPASASSIVTQTGVHSYCGLLPNNGGDCLFYPVSASGGGPLIVSGPAYSAYFKGYYFNGSAWVEGHAGWVPIAYNGQGTLLTGVVRGTAEQVTSYGITDNFTLIY